MNKRYPSAAPAALAAMLAVTLGASMPRAASAQENMPQSLAQATDMERQDQLPMSGFYDAPSLSGSKPGDLLRQEPGAGYVIPKGSRAVRFLYHSQAADGSDVATSGVVLIPAGPAPTGGWSVIAWAHGTSGVARMCAPSLMRDLEYGEEGLLPMVRAGFAVVATDYHGLGTTGPHQYVSKIAQSRDVIYAVQAARAAVPELGRAWVVVGHSQGGLAAWGVAELEAKLHDPDYRGAVSVAGAADLRDVLKSMSGSGKDAAFYLAYMAYAVHAQSPHFKPEQMLAGAALDRYADVTTKGCWYYAYASFLNAPAGDVLAPGWDKVPAVEKFFKGNELGAAPIRGPLLVIAGEGDRTVPIAAVRATVQKACQNGISLMFHSYHGLDHDPTLEKSTPDFIDWIRQRFAGQAAPQGCYDYGPDVRRLDR
jgi:pimeloyl-ACP methyl ester carboxylesterase